MNQIHAIATTLLVLCASARASAQENPATTAEVTDRTSDCPVTAPKSREKQALKADDPSHAWGVAGVRLFAGGEKFAPNGVPFGPLFSLDLNFNLWVWRSQGLYFTTDLRFWGQEAEVGITNVHQGVFDFSKREFDLMIGAAWNYSGPLEARLFAYSFNNLNRGVSPDSPRGFKDGMGVENRLYLNDAYERLGQSDYDQQRANFVSLGYFPTKDWIDEDGHSFKPGLFACAYLTHDLWGPNYFVYFDARMIAKESLAPKLLTADAGVALRPFYMAPTLELRVGAENTYDLEVGDVHALLYGAMRVRF